MAYQLHRDIDTLIADSPYLPWYDVRCLMKRYRLNRMRANQVDHMPDGTLEQQTAIDNEWAFCQDECRQIQIDHADCILSR